MLKNILISNYKVIALVVIFSLLLSLLPLTNVFSYEFSIIESIFLSLIFGLYGLTIYNSQASSKFNIDSIYFLTTLLIIPIFISIISTKLGQNCPLYEGFQYYSIVTIPSAIYGLSLGIFVASFFNRWGKSILVFLWFITLLFPIFEIYFNPQIYFYNPIIGFFPGTIYDEDIKVGINFLTYRITVLLFSLIIIWISFKIRNSIAIKKLTILLAMSLAVVMFLLFKPRLGYATTKQTIKSNLHGELITEHFDIIYSSKISHKKIKNLALHHEYYFNLLNSSLNYTPKERIISYVFYDNNEKRKYFGAGNADVAKPWLGEIYTSWEHYDSTLKHELAHIFSGGFGWSLFKVAYGFNPAMIEGFAMALENNFDNSDIDYVTANAIKSGKKINIKELFTGFNFFKQNSSISYVYAGSFIKYLLTNYGVEQVKKVYGDLNFEKHFHKNLTQLTNDFELYIQNIKLSVSKNSAQLYFNRKTIQSRVCVRFTANELKKAWELYNSGAYLESMRKFKRIYSHSRNYMALLGQTLSLKSSGMPLEAKELWTKNEEIFKQSAYYFNFLIMLGDLNLLNGNFDNADSAYTKIIRMNPSQDYYNLALIKRYLIKRDSTHGLNYINGSYFDKYNILDKIQFKELQYSTVPLMLGLYIHLKPNYTNFISRFKSLTFDSSYSSAVTALKLSKFAKDNDDFGLAQYYANKGLLLSGKAGFKIIINSNIDKVTWMKQNYQHIIGKIKFIE